jgi:hypothetical protein
LSKNQVIEAVRQQTITVNSFSEVDLSDLQCPIIAVYINPVDYPQDCVARVFDLEQPTNIILIRRTLEELRTDIIQTYPWMVRFDRAKNDVQCIAETWL